MNFEDYEKECMPGDGEISVTESARRLRKTEGYVYSLLRVGRLAGRKTPAGRWWVSADAVERRREERTAAIR
jgi:hypothetical protein